MTTAPTDGSGRCSSSSSGCVGIRWRFRRRNIKTYQRVCGNRDQRRRKRWRVLLRIEPLSFAGGVCSSLSERETHNLLFSHRRRGIIIIIVALPSTGDAGHGCPSKYSAIGRNEAKNRRYLGRLSQQRSVIDASACRFAVVDLLPDDLPILPIARCHVGERIGSQGSLLDDANLAASFLLDSQPC